MFKDQKTKRDLYVQLVSRMQRKCVFRFRLKNQSIRQIKAIQNTTCTYPATTLRLSEKSDENSARSADIRCCLGQSTGYRADGLKDEVLTANESSWRTHSHVNRKISAPNEVEEKNIEGIGRY
ncbi:hypothetical protein llap_10176 [Limosa lapponica baueri]|uniref:Uncharacterized protein n=1 Tax=Limosa lapponica baueri TaxID=1758121 RepID=A0A2I0U0B9_LIMLA|nr:hypothetical protein llap_10176 [Limosa lapponica baueri]